MTTRWPRRTSKLLFVALTLVLVARPAAAQTTATGVIDGVVKDAAGAPLGQALVMLAPQGSGEGVTVTTDHSGRFRFAALRPGDYTLSAELLGYPPTHVRGIPARPGRETVLEVALEGTRDPAPAPVTRDFAGTALRTGRAGVAEWLAGAASQPSERGEVRDLLHRSARFRDAGDVEGLTTDQALLLLDGTPFRAARHPALRAAGLPVSGFALHAFESGLAAAVPLGPELPHGASGVLGAHVPAGYGGTRFDVEVRGTSDVIPGAGVERGDVPGFQESLGAARVSGADANGSAEYSAGVYLRQVERPVSAAWAVTDASSEILGEATERGAAVSGLVRSSTLADRAFGAHLGGSVRLADQHRLQGTLHYVSIPRLQAVDPASGLLASARGDDFVAGVALRSTMARSSNELRASFTGSARESTLPDPLPATFFVSEGLALGAPGADGRAAERTLRLTDAFTLHRGSTGFTLGADVLLTSHEVRQGAQDEVFFGGVPELRAGTGVRTRLEPGPVLVEWTTPVYALFAAVRFAPLPGLSVSVGARGESEALPTDDVRFDPTWFELTKTLRNTAAEGAGWQVAPRLAVSWDLDGAQRWLLDLDAGVYTERHDPLLLAAWQQFDGNASMRRTHGTIGWPATATEGGTIASRLLLLASDFEPVRSTRVSAGVTHRIAPGATFQLGAVVRRTRNLPQRLDVNLRTNPPRTDQHGRGVFGTLQQQGALLVGQPGTGRNFAQYDEVAGIGSEASSDYLGVTFGVEAELPASLDLAVRYTFSSTRDDWFAGRTGGWRTAAPADLRRNGWVDGTSDFDVPHRLAAALAWDAPLGGRVSGTFRLESGLPFTPGFRYGVDVNGDGDAGNDPAFVDPQVPRINDLLAGWSCLAEASGRFVERNACRGDALKALDLAARVPVLRFGTATASLAVEAIHLLGAGPSIPDPALYLVDRDDFLTTEGTRVTVPLLVNPGFGSPLVRPEGGRRVRVGAAIAW